MPQYNRAELFSSCRYYRKSKESSDGIMEELKDSQKYPDGTVVETNVTKRK